MKPYSVAFNIRSSIVIHAESEQEARRKLLDPDVTSSVDLFKELEANICDIGNEAITIDDVWEVEETDEA